MNLKFLAAVLLFGSILICPSPLLACVSDINKNKQAADYYKSLRERCDDDSCCLHSVNVMEANGFEEAKNGKCPDHVERDMLKCTSTLVWCEKPTYLITDCIDQK